MLSLCEQKYRLKKNLNKANNVIWHENKAERFRISKPSDKKGSLWLRITKGNETFAISTTGLVTTELENFIRRTVGVPNNKEVNHRDWLNVKFDDAMRILKTFDVSS